MRKVPTNNDETIFSPDIGHHPTERANAVFFDQGNNQIQVFSFCTIQANIFRCFMIFQNAFCAKVFFA